MIVKEVCSHNVISTSPETTIRQASAIMKREHVGDVVVVDCHNAAKRPIGILTDRDITSHVVAEGLDPEVVCVGDIMTRNVHVIGANEETTVASRMMRSAGIRRLPVVDDRGNLCGIVALDDLLSWSVRDIADLVSVNAVQMTKERTRVSMHEHFAPEKEHP